MESLSPLVKGHKMVQVVGNLMTGSSINFLFHYLIFFIKNKEVINQVLILY